VHASVQLKVIVLRAREQALEIPLAERALV
jgi:hypothetical protein